MRSVSCNVIILLVIIPLALVTDTTVSAFSFPNRRQVLQASLAPILLSWSVQAAETVGKDPSCNDKNCLGVWDGLLADCPRNNTCVSSQDDTPGIFAEPWDYAESESINWEDQMERLLPAILSVSRKRGDGVTVDLKEGRYLRVRFTNRNEAAVGEFYFTLNDTTVQFRISGGSKNNRERAEAIRKELRYLKLPVLRNRRRRLFLVESEMDTFGPGSAALGPPAEMRTGELEGHQDVDPKLKIDLLQQFPVATDQSRR